MFIFSLLGQNVDDDDDDEMMMRQAGFGLVMMMKRALSLLSGSGQGATLSGWCPRPITTNRGKEGGGGVVTRLKKCQKLTY